jgi:hypothetical protein
MFDYTRTNYVLLRKYGSESAMGVRTGKVMEVGDLDLDLNLCVLEFKKWRWAVLCAYRLFDYSV